jgi:Rrf2 family protein
MKISTKGRYALKLMLDIAVNSNGKPVRIKEIAARQGISDKYLEQIIASLNKAGLVSSIRGPQGGYMLTAEPSEYTAGKILRVAEGDMAPVSCLDSEVNTCPRKGDCITLPLYEQIDEAINKVIDKVTMQDLIDEYRAAKEQ